MNSIGHTLSVVTIDDVIVNSFVHFDVITESLRNNQFNVHLSPFDINLPNVKLSC